MTRVLHSRDLRLLGLDAFDRLLDWTAKPTGDSFPPFNIEQPAPDALRIELAVAGFAPEELSVQVEDDQLIVRGRRIEPQARTYLHRGIAARQFRRVFKLADGLEVDCAHLGNGILAIDIKRALTIAPVHRIAILSAGSIDGGGRPNGRKG